MINDNPMLMALHEGKRMAFAQMLDMINALYNDELMPDKVDELYKYARAKVCEEVRILNETFITLEKEKSND